MFIMLAGAHYTIPYYVPHTLLPGCVHIAIIGICRIDIQAGILYA